MKRRILSTILALTLALSQGITALAAGSEPSASQKYVEAMGHGWNLGNSFDGFNSDEGAVSDETSWGNPVVTRELIQAVKAKGFDSIRIPLTLSTRYTEADGKCTVDPEWLTRYKEVVDWAVEADLYVMVNIHHDSWIWLSGWDGKEESAEYVRFQQMWEQLADCLKDEPAQVCFETINEPQFNDGTEEEKQEKLDKLNLAAYKIIRGSGGKNGERMIVMLTLNTNHEKCAPLLKLIQGLDDENIIATVHYYGEWVYSANLGITGYDEVMGDDGNTPRKAAKNAMEMVYKAFTENGIGTVIGEYGVLGYDAGEECNQPGEELKCYEYINQLGREYGLCLMFWDNGSGIDRRSNTYQWKKPVVGAMLEASIKGRSSYAAELDTLYFKDRTDADVTIPLMLNGNTFKGIEGLTEGTEYSYDAKASTVMLKADYINKLFEAKDGYGELAVLTFQFSSGADWRETLVKYGTPAFSDASGTASEGLTIPVSYQGAKVRRITAYAGEERTGPQSSWWRYLQHTETFVPDYAEGTLTMKPSFFNECAEGEISLVIEFYDGQTAGVKFTKDGDKVFAGNGTTVSPAAFTDLKDGAWYLDAVSYVVSKNIMNGVTAVSFAPGDPLSRAQMCQIIYNMAGKPDVSGESNYSDISDASWYVQPVTWCCINKIAEGRSDKAFEPNAPITREEVTDFLYRYTVYQGKDVSAQELDAFTDAGDVSEDMIEAMGWAVGHGIIQGKPDGTLVPGGTATRAEISAMMMRFCEAV
jgi:endoglucanase